MNAFDSVAQFWTVISVIGHRPIPCSVLLLPLVSAACMSLEVILLARVMAYYTWTSAVAFIQGTLERNSQSGISTLV